MYIIRCLKYNDRHTKNHTHQPHNVTMLDCVGDIFSRISVVVDETVDERIDELTNMTCIDCKYFNPNIRIKPEWVNQGLCEKRLTNGYAEYPSFDCEICGMFKPKEDCWDEVSK